jgi:hypothetical protein
LVASDPEGPDALTDGSTRPPRCPRRHAQIRRAGKQTVPIIGRYYIHNRIDQGLLKMQTGRQRIPT